MELKKCSLRKESDCPCEDYNEYEVKLKCVKTKLHSRYISCIAAGIVIWVLATGDANNAEFSSWISFASTITSIILSVIAIIISITGESKTDAMREKMEETTKHLNKTAQSIDEANEQNQNNVIELKQNIMLLQNKIELLQGRTNEVLNRYEKQSETDVQEKKNISNEIIWVNRYDK